MDQFETHMAFGGHVRRYRHDSEVLGCKMVFTVFHPPRAPTSAAAELRNEAGQVPVVYWLSGLTCTDENFIQKAGALRRAAQQGLALVVPDTSPRGLGIEGEDDDWDFGTGAGFYLNATQDKWKAYRMYDYITKELPALLRMLPDLDVDRAGIMGHSMGGHGALTIALKNPSAFRSVSAFSPICNPSNVPWGVKAFTNYLGEDREAWKEYDATELVRAYKGAALPVLVDTGSEDQFLQTQLRPWVFEEASLGKLALSSHFRMHDGYDHSYFFIATYIDEHLLWHAKYLRNEK